MKIITLWQPWASFVALGWKTIETRTHDRFKNLAGEIIGIHAGNTWDKDWEELAGNYMSEYSRDKTKIMHRLFRSGIGKGQILCTAKVEAVDWLTVVIDSSDAMICCDPRIVGYPRFGLFLSDIKTIHPIPAKGKQGIWNYDFKPDELVYL